MSNYAIVCYVILHYYNIYIYIIYDSISFVPVLPGSMGSKTVHLCEPIWQPLYESSMQGLRLSDGIGQLLELSG